MRALLLAAVLLGCSTEDPETFEPFCILSVSGPTPDGGGCVTQIITELVCDDAIDQVYDRVILRWTLEPNFGLADTRYQCNARMAATFSTPCQPVIGAVSFQHPTLGGDPFELAPAIRCEKTGL